MVIEASVGRGKMKKMLILIEMNAKQRKVRVQVARFGV